MTKEYLCRLCDWASFDVVYRGPIRSGGVGTDFVEGYEIRACMDCGLASLYPLPDNLSEFYESESYRQQFFDDIDVASMQRKYDVEQNARVKRIGIQTIRGKSIADFGAGPGLFLDSIQGVAGETIAIEPSCLYQGYFHSRGHIAYKYAHELLAAGKQVDVAVSFDTIEHILDIGEFVEQIYNAMKEDAVFYLSMPNYNDVVRLICPEAFEPFFYQISHLNYFSGRAASFLLEKTGFKKITLEYLHKYNLNNLLQWTRHGKPGLFDTSKAFDTHFQNVYVEEVERLGIASHIFITARKN